MVARCQTDFGALSGDAGESVQVLGLMSLGVTSLCQTASRLTQAWLRGAAACSPNSHGLTLMTAPSDQLPGICRLLCCRSAWSSCAGL